MVLGLRAGALEVPRSDVLFNNLGLLSTDLAEMEHVVEFELTDASGKWAQRPSQSLFLN